MNELSFLQKECTFAAQSYFRENNSSSGSTFYWNPSSGFLIHDLEKGAMCHRSVYTCGQRLSNPSKRASLRTTMSLLKRRAILQSILGIFAYVNV